MNKAEFLSLIESKMDIKLETYQLDYLFNSNMYRVMSTPRQGGKDFIAALDLLYTSYSENRQSVAFCATSKTDKLHFKKVIENFVDILDGYFITSSSNDSIRFSNDSVIYLISSNDPNSLRGHRVKKVVIMEPDSIISPNMFEVLLARAEIALNPADTDTQISVLGTHTYMKSNLLSCILNPYYYKIQVNVRNNITKHSEEMYNRLRKEMSRETYMLEIENRFTPRMINSMFNE